MGDFVHSLLVYLGNEYVPNGSIKRMVRCKVQENDQLVERYLDWILSIKGKSMVYLYINSATLSSSIFIFNMLSSKINPVQSFYVHLFDSDF